LVFGIFLVLLLFPSCLAIVSCVTVVTPTHSYWHSGDVFVVQDHPSHSTAPAEQARPHRCCTCA
jgi:hypothetical protein